MNAYLPVCAIMLAVCATAFAMPAPESESESETASSVDKFYEHFKNGSDVQALLDEAMNTMDTVTQYKHCKFIQKLASFENPKQEFAKKVQQAAQNRLDALLKQIGYDGQIDVKKYISALYEMKTTHRLEDQEFLKKLQKVSQLQTEYEKKKAAQQSDAEPKDDVSDHQVVQHDESVNNVQEDGNQW